MNFNTQQGNYEQTGLARLKSDGEIGNYEILYPAPEDRLPHDFVSIRVQDIDTQDDYINAAN